MPMFIDTHCHLDAPEFRPQALAIREDAAIKGVAHCVLPAVAPFNFEGVRTLAHAAGDSYALGIHPLYVAQVSDDALADLDAQLHQHLHDPRLVAVGEIGLDLFVPALTQPPLRERQIHVYREQLKLARKHGLPVILQAQAFIALGFKLGFGGAVTFERALQLRHLAATLPLEALVLETDAPDIPPHWLYTTAAERLAGQPQGRNTPGELPRIAQVVADLRGIRLEELAQATTRNAMVALPRLAALLSS
jgi:TatD DNase family protein